MISFITEEKLQEEIRKIQDAAPKKIVEYDLIIKFCRDILEQYREEIRKKKFKNTEDEIIFFKKHKQIPAVNLIYYQELRKLEVELSLTKKLKRKKLLKKSEELDKFIQMHLNFVKYIELQESHLDEIYFTRKFLSVNDHFNSFYFPDQKFNTSHDFLLSQINANKLLQNFLQKELQKLSFQAIGNKKEDQKFEWTSSKVALIELIYALQINGSINNGNADLISIASSFEELFNIKLDNIYKTYSEIKYRKGRRTKFLDDLTWQFEQKLNREEEI